MANGLKKNDPVWLQEIKQHTENTSAVVTAKNNDGTYDVAVVGQGGVLVIKENVDATMLVPRTDALADRR